MGLGDFLLSTVEEALASPETAAICHLILDTCSELPGWHPHLAPHHATGVLLRCAAEQPRLAPKVAAAFHMTVDALSVPDQVALLDAISGLLDASATSAAGVALLLHFGTPVQRHFHLEAVLEDLVLSNQDPVATRMVQQLGSREMQCLYVSFCLQYGQLRSANNAVRAFGLQHEYPDVERLHKAKQLDKMCSKGLWGVAGQYAGEDPQLQRTLVQAMLLAGELLLAQEHMLSFGLQGEFAISPERLAEEQARRREQYLQLPSNIQLHFVDNVDALVSMGQYLERLLQQRRQGSVHHSIAAGGAAPAAAKSATAVLQGEQLLQAAAVGAAGAASSSAVEDIPTDASEHVAGPAAVVDRDAEMLPALGLDLEWQPTDAENSSPPSLLQLSTDTEVFLVDLLALASHEAELAAALTPALVSDRVFKLGCGIASDCKKLADHHAAAFSLVRSCLDLSVMWRSHHIEQSGKRSTAGFKRRAGEVSLSMLAQTVLGKPLDKSQQVSNWGQRPLSAQQLSYAALDAYAAVQIFRGMGQEHHPLRTQQGLSHHAFNYDRRHGGISGGGHHSPARRPPGGGNGGQTGSNGGNHAHGHGHSSSGTSHSHGSSGSEGGSRGHNGGPQAAAAFSGGAAVMGLGWSPACSLPGSFAGSRGPRVAPLHPSGLAQAGRSKAAAQRQVATRRMLLHLLPMRLLRHVTCLL
ncbi:exonuclease mut-7 [Chlorella sorokiniana]|uniref:Exonuclease mut-7 n=1 Tax=Chlorella sorokiniana TaxID=3076 RepID=A0A2P6U432_CHLSO|nr:exonuclease mut-7 [Chlorella sorokiniana]|eukprot:PRW61071.1 exonuclease mut-7 [Chlorella sorokiniana]